MRISNMWRNLDRAIEELSYTRHRRNSKTNNAALFIHEWAEVYKFTLYRDDGRRGVIAPDITPVRTDVNWFFTEANVFEIDHWFDHQDCNWYGRDWAFVKFDQPVRDGFAGETVIGLITDVEFIRPLHQLATIVHREDFDWQEYQFKLAQSLHDTLIGSLQIHPPISPP